MTFFAKLEAATARNRSLLCVGLDPSPQFLTRDHQSDRHLGQLAAWLREIVDQTAEWVCAYKPTLDLYLALGPEGLALLQEVLAGLPREVPVVLDAKHANGITSGVFAELVFERWGVDALTVAEFAGLDRVAPFLTYADRALFALCYTENPSARSLQDRRSPLGSSQDPQPEPFWRDLVRDIETWGVPAQVGLEIEASEPEIFAQVRAAAPNRLLLVRGIWSSGDDLSAQDYARDLTPREVAALEGSLRRTLPALLDARGGGAMILVPRAALSHPDPGAQVRSLRHHLERVRQAIVHPPSHPTSQAFSIAAGPAGPPDRHGAEPRENWLAPTPAEAPLAALILQLHELGCILFGEYVQASGETFSYYIDLRQIISQPDVFQQIVLAYAGILEGLTFDRLAGIPYGSLPTATGLSLHLNRPMIYPRKEVKAHGTQRTVEGTFHAGERVVVVDDILISGKSALDGIAKLESVGLVVQDVVVLIDHESGAKARLAQRGYRAHAVIGLGDIARTLHRAGRLSDRQFAALHTEALT